MAPSKPVSWEDSRHICKRTGMHLVYIESIEELHFLEKIIRNMKKTTEYFIGLQKQSGEWRWISNYRKESTSEGYLQWATDEPSGNGNCSEMYLNTKKHLWYDDLRCDRRKERVGYICERAVKCNDEKGMSQEQYYTFRKIYEFVLRNIHNQNKHSKVKDCLVLKNEGVKLKTGLNEDRKIHS